MSRRTFSRVCKLMAIAVATSGLGLANPFNLAAATRRPKVKLQKPQEQITAAHYDKIWRNWQIGTKKEKDAAVKELRAIVRKSPEEFMAHYYLGIMISETGSPAQALRHFETALIGFPKSADIHARMGTILDSRNKADEAVEHFQQALKLDPNEPRALARLGIHALENGDLETSYDLLYKARQVQPDNPETLRSLGAILIEKNSAAEALPVLEQALLFDQKHAETHWLLARAYEKLAQPEKATEHFNEARKLGRRDPGIKELIGYDLARNLLRSGKSSEAETEYKKEIRKNADPATGYYELAQLYEDTGRENEAVEAYVQAYNLNKSLGEGVMRSADIFLRREEYDNAESVLNLLKSDAAFKDRAKEELAEIKDARERQEKLRLEAEMADRAINDAGIEENFMHMLELNKNDADALDGLMNFYQERGYYDQALYWFRKYNRVNPTSDHQKKLIENELKHRFELDNFTLFGYKKPVEFKYSQAADDNLMNLAFNGENDRLREVAAQILLSRKEYKENRSLIEGLLEFYAERGRVSEAIKYVNIMKRLGYYTAAEATEKRAKLRGK